MTFPAYASGPVDAVKPLVFRTSTGFDLTLTQAAMHVGALYLTASVLNPSSQNSSCVEPGRYVGEVAPSFGMGGVDIDLLSPAPQVFSSMGDGTVDIAQSAEVWLTGGDINAADDPTPVVILTGAAERGAETYPFRARITIGSNRKKAVSDISQPGLNPLCKRRIVQVSPVQVALTENGSLRLRIDPRGFFNAVDFSNLDLVSSSPLLYEIPDSDSSGTTGEAAGRNLFTGVRTGVLASGESAYSFTFEKY